MTREDLTEKEGDLWVNSWSWWCSKPCICFAKNIPGIKESKCKGPEAETMRRRVWPEQRVRSESTGQGKCGILSAIIRAWALSKLGAIGGLAEQSQDLRSNSHSQNNSGCYRDNRHSGQQGKWGDQLGGDRWWYTVSNDYYEVSTVLYSLPMLSHQLLHSICTKTLKVGLLNSLSEKKLRFWLA